MPKVLDLIQKRQLLNVTGYIYLEYESELALDLDQWQLQTHRELKAGQVRCVLARQSTLPTS